MEALIWVGVTALIIALPLWLPRWRLNRALARPLPAEALDILGRNMPIYARMPAELQAQLQRLVAQFLYQKRFIGCDGLEVDDEMRVTIAGQACLLLLNRYTRVYPELHTILVYPSEFLVERSEVGPGGVITESEDGLLGESWGDGRVILAWDHVQRGAADWSDGSNVVLHEFAHQLDSESGAPNGAPFLGDASNYHNWAAVLSRDYADLRHDAIYRQPSVLDHYGANSPAEFFAVATETFFEKPHQMAARHAALYGELQKYYRVDPRDWLPAPAPEWAAHDCLEQR
ncbi:zinc-dependent peptidase [Janthinobacterium fluminis]|uniref:Zinc-dependent peptidase n=1 Tax=Janthinobacterium fluminis TaxID=2987524 RepID=A0ABT5K602_9BURK|nr:M90 family metallopeptidase [Janthinobacterium fluminis]MDC8760080.1 zinc-dependent peptidase [Janthinobacterium fluminis]